MKRIICRSFLFCLITGLGLSFSNSPNSSFGTQAADTPRAPYSAEWRLTGPTGGDVRGLVVDPNDADRFYFGTLDGQIYTSSDGARTWRMLVNLNRPRLFVDHIIVDPRDSKRLLPHIGTRPAVFPSTDGGLIWRDAPELRKEVSIR
jgi:hypothetical protein